MRRLWVMIGLLAGCSAPYEVPTDDLARPLERVKPEVTTIDNVKLMQKNSGQSMWCDAVIPYFRLHGVLIKIQKSYVVETN